MKPGHIAKRNFFARNVLFLGAMISIAACSGGSDDTKPSVTLSEADIALAPLFSPCISPTKYANNVVYELAIHDFRASGAVLSRLEILDGETNEILASFTDRQLNDNADTRILRFPPWSEQPKLFLWIRLDPAKALPQSVIHRLVFTDPATSLECLTVTVCPLSVAASDPVVLAPPVGAGLWVANETSSNQSHHRLADFSLDGRETVPQRFAVDLLKVVDENVCNGSVDSNECFWSFSENLLAVADGTVVTASDGLEDNVMGSPKREFSREEITGNCVVIDIGSGKFAHYNHMKNGTVCVKSGDQVTRGMVIGKIGNSGSSDAPHLHFQVSDRADFLTGDGLPFVFESFSVRREHPDIATVLSDPRTNEAPESQAIIEFN